ERVQDRVPVVDAGVPTEGGGVEPDVAVRQLHTLGPGGGAARVVDRGGGVLVRGPSGGLELAVWPELGVGLGPDGEAVLGVDAGQVVFELGVHHQHGGAGVADDVADLLLGQAEVDR